MCDCLVALPSATDGPFTLFAKNSDRPPAEPQEVAWSPARRDDGPLRVTHISVDPYPAMTVGCLLSRPAWCWGAEHGVNEAGVAIGNATVYTTLDPRPAPPALVGMDLVRLALERSTCAKEAVHVVTSLLERYGQGGSGHDVSIVGAARPYWSSFLVADGASSWVVDTSGREWAAEAVDGVRAISNRTSIPTFDSVHRHPRQPVESLVEPRLRASEAVLAARPVTTASLARHLRSHDSCSEAGWSVCMHVPGVEVTTASMIAELHTDDDAHRAWVLRGSPCEHDYVEVPIGRSFVNRAVRAPGPPGLREQCDR